MSRKDSRRYRRSLARRFQDKVDLDRLDYALRTRVIRGQAIMRGVVAAVAVYVAGFALGYYGWTAGTVSYEQFVDFVWIWMVPASAVGGVTGLISKNRLEYPVREDVKACIRALEGERGWLWRYGPLLEALAPGDADQRMLVRRSREGRVEDLTPEDYPRAVQQLQRALADSGSAEVTDEVLAAVEHNVRHAP